MRRTLQRVLFSLLFIHLACDNVDISGPTPPPPPPPIEEPQAPRVDVPFSVDAYQGYIFFGAGGECQSDDEVDANVRTMLAYGWNTPQICSETEFWDGGCGSAYPQKKRDPERLKLTLDRLARIPGVQVALVGNCTLKRQVPLQEQFEWAETVAKVASEYKNVAIFTHNEFDNCRGRNDWGGSAENCAGKQDVAQHIQLFKSYGFQVVTADDSYHPPKPEDPAQLTYGFRLSNIGAYPASFHPDREKNNQPWDPSLNQLRQLAKFNGEFLLSETVAIMDFSGNCRGLRTCDIARIEAYIDLCSQVPECHFTLHSENLLMGLPPHIIPSAR